MSHGGARTHAHGVHAIAIIVFPFHEIHICVEIGIDALLLYVLLNAVVSLGIIPR